MGKYAIVMILILESVLIALAFESAHANFMFFAHRSIKMRIFFFGLLQILVSLIKNVIDLTKGQKG